MINDDSTMTIHQGGVPGIPSGAPEEYIKKQERNKTMLEEATKKDASQVRLSSGFNIDDIPSDPRKTGDTGMPSKWYQLQLPG